MMIFFVKCHEEKLLGNSAPLEFRKGKLRNLIFVTFSNAKGLGCKLTKDKVGNNDYEYC